MMGTMMHWKGKTVLVTGGTGFIGSFLVERLLDAGATLRVPIRAQNYRSLSARRGEIEWMEGDLRDPAYCMRLVDGVDEVFHLAACRRTVRYHEKRSSQVMIENVRTTLSLLEALREREPVPVTFFSTANVPPNASVLTLSQQQKLDGYVLGKAICETLWFTAAHERSFPLLIARPVGVYGPRDTFAEDGNVVPALMVKARASTQELEVWGTGKEERTFLYVEDLVEALLRLVNAGAEGVQYISSPDVCTVRQLAEQIRDLVQPGLPIHFEPKKPIGPRTIPLLKPHASLERMRWTPLEKGLQKTHDAWMRKAELSLQEV